MTTPPSQSELVRAFERAVVTEDAEYASLRAAILKHPGAPSLLRERAQSAAWRERLMAEILLGWLDHKAERDAAFALLKDPAKRKTKTVIGVAKPLEVAEQLAQLGPTITPWVIEAWLKTHEHVDDWEEAVLSLALAELRDSRSFEPMSELFTNKTAPEPKRTAAAHVLEELADGRALSVAQHVLGDTTEPDLIRQAAAGVMIAANGPAAREPIERVLCDPGSPIELQKGLAYTLAELGDPASKPALERSISSAADSDVIPSLAFALGRVGDDGSVDVLRATAERTNDSAAHDACEDAVREIALRRQLAQRPE